MKINKISILVCLVFISNVLSGQQSIYISPTGSDKNVGTKEQPFATLQKARNHIRELKKNGLKQDVNVYLRGGTYFISETFELGLQDSAPDGHRITYKNFDNEHPVISSGIKVTGWTKESAALPGLPEAAKGKVWSAPIPKGILKFYTLYEGDNRLTRAVTKGFFPTREYFSNGAQKEDDLYLLEFPAGAVKNWDNLTDVELFIQPAVAWTMNILPLAWVDEKKKLARTSIPASNPLTTLKHERFPDGTAWIENVFEGLDAPGRWVVNSKTRKIYYWPANNMPSNNILVPKLKVLIKVAGDSRLTEATDIPVKGIHFEGLTFTHADRDDTWDMDDSGIQHDWEMEDKDNAMLRFRGAEDCSVNACHFYNAGGNAIRLDYHAQRIEIKNSLFHDLGQSAVMMIGYGPGTKDVNKYNKVINNHIYDCGQIWWHSQMITMWQSGENHVAHNYIHNVPRKAIAISGVRPPAFRKDLKAFNIRETRRSIRFNEVGNASKLEELQPFLHARNNIVEYNKIHHALERLGDGGAINASGAGLGNVIRYNYIYDIFNPQANSNIRTDNAQIGTTISHNIVSNSVNVGIAPKGRNLVNNNYLIDVSKGTGKGMIQGLGNFGNSDIINNIFLSTGTNDHFYNFIKDDKPPVVYKQMTDNVVDKNIYYRENTPDFKPTKILSDFQQNGFDKNSLYTDPLFVDWKNGDFTLKQESPALKLGIEQIDVSKIGLTKEFPSYLKSITSKSKQNSEKLAILTSISSSEAKINSVTKKPNILIIYADDWGWGDLAIHGHKELKTPNLDKLASQGIDFHRFTVANPVCSPSRTALITGQYPARHSVHNAISNRVNNAKNGVVNWLDPKVTLLPRLLKEAGYATAHYGKWHLSLHGEKNVTPDVPLPAAYGYDDAAIFTGPGKSVWDNSSFKDKEGHGPADRSFASYLTAAATEHTIRFINENKHKPFFINLWIHETHTILSATEEDKKAYPNTPEPQLTYYASVTRADRLIGQVLKTLKDLGLENNTIVIFSSDNGPEDPHEDQTHVRYNSVGSSGGFRGRKRSLYYGGVGTPFIARWPGHIPAGKIDNTSVITGVDILPTLLAAANISLPTGYKPDGVNILPALKGEEFTRNQPICWEWRGPFNKEANWPKLAIQEGDMKLLMSDDPQRIELYNVVKDRGEQNNLAETNPKLVNDLKKKLLEWKSTLPKDAPVNKKK